MPGGLLELVAPGPRDIYWLSMEHQEIPNFPILEQFQIPQTTILEQIGWFIVNNGFWIVSRLGL